MPEQKNPYSIDRILRLAVNALLIGGFIWLLGYLSDVLIPFAVALLLAYILNPLVNWTQRWIKNRIAAIIASLGMVMVIVAAVAALLTPLILADIKQMGTVLSKLADSTDLSERARQMLPGNTWETIREIASQKEVQAFFQTEKFWEMAQTLSQKVLPGVWGLIAGTTSFLLGLVGLFVILLYLVFLLIDYRKFKEQWKGLLPDVYRDAIVDFVQEFDSGMNRYFRAQALVAAIVGVISALGFWIINLPMGILLGLFVGLLNMVPYLQLVALFPAALLAVIHALETGGGIWLMLGLTGLVFVVAQAVQDGILVPRIMGGITGLSPAVILLSLSIWGKLLGMLGLIIAIPFTCLMFAYYKRFFVKNA